MQGGEVTTHPVDKTALPSRKATNAYARVLVLNQLRTPTTPAPPLWGGAWLMRGCGEIGQVGRLWALRRIYAGL